ncbi:dimethylarginine dimethylaminohydrolase family protein [Bacillus sp. DJP31]|uniref:dimethylarginine dimethylaminohydrolase family protein n=1 Tax=Bacillus sp. DJP31 TaxID=3409789 RepID=UPI003BB5D15D
MLQQSGVHCFNEYDRLQKVIVCKPKFMSYGNSLYVKNGESVKSTIEIDKAMSQHGEFVKKLREHHVDVMYLPPMEQYSEGVFTRDIGFALGSEMYIAKMAHPPRIGEEEGLIHALNEAAITHHDLMKDHIEGGDVMVDGKTLYVGVSNRTHDGAILHLKSLLPEYEVIPLPFSDQFLHLDVIFNILSPTEALIYPGELSEEKEALLSKRYELIEVSETEQATLGTNILSIGDKKVFSLPMNEGVNKQLQNRGYEVIEVDFSEIIKSGGAFRCCSLPLYRG